MPAGQPAAPTGLAREVLRFAAAHPVISGDQTVLLTGAETAEVSATLVALTGQGLLVKTRVLPRGRALYQITEAGTEQAGGDAVLPALELSGLREAIVAGWVWVSAQDGHLGDCRVLSEWEMIAADLALAKEDQGAGGATGRFGVRVGGFPASNRSGLHHPDVLIAYGRDWTAVHVQLRAAQSDWLAALLRAYGADERFAGLQFVVDEPWVARQVRAAAVRAGVGAMTAVEWMRPPAA